MKRSVNDMTPTSGPSTPNPAAPDSTGQTPPAAHGLAPRRRLNPLLILALALIALARPLTNIVADQAGTDLGPLVPLGWTLLISLVWIAVVGLTGTARPVLTLVLAALAYAVFAIILSGILSPILLGRLEGPLANPLAIVPLLATNAVWGLLTGALALAVQRLRGLREQR